MKQGKDIHQLATELHYIKENAKDLIVPTQKMKVIEFNNVMTLELANNDSFSIMPVAHQQIATYSDIPKGYYDKLLSENPYILGACINHGFQMAINLALAAKRPKHDSRLVRTVNGKMRAFLSDRYRVLDSYDLFITVAPILIEHGFKVLSSELTEKRMYIKAVTDKIQGEVMKGHAVQYGIIVSSSDVGFGSIKVEPLMYELVCQNGMIMERSLKKFHIGKSQMEDQITELLSDETKQASDKAFWLTVRDTLLGTMRQDIFEESLNTLRVAANQPLILPIPEIVEKSMKAVNIAGEQVKTEIMNYLLNGADGRGLNQWALANAFTYAAQSSVVDYDTSTDLERAGGKIIELLPAQWKTLNT